MLNETADLVTKDTHEAEEQNAFFVLVFTRTMCFGKFKASQTSGKFWGNDDFSFTKENKATEHLQ